MEEVKIVLILVVMDDALVHVSAEDYEIIEQLVLILVVMDDALVLSKMLFPHTKFPKQS